METRPYIVTMADGSKRLVEATNPAHAVRYVAKGLIAGVGSASAKDVIDLMGNGIKVESASMA